ncbi:MAG: hypothetical protein H7259_06140 [Cytophagales bacterium]|nr:hypothetical protein [Cytophaga sp.]
MRKKILFLFFLSAIQYVTYATDSTMIYGSWKLHYYHVYTHGKGMDTIMYTTGHVYFNKDHTYTTDKLQACFMEGNNYVCPSETGGIWGYTAEKVIQITYNDHTLHCDGPCPELIDRHGVYIAKMSEDYVILRTEYFNAKRKHRLTIDAYLVRKVE